MPPMQQLMLRDLFRTRQVSSYPTADQKLRRFVVTVMTLKCRPAWSGGAVCPWCEEEIVVFKHVWCITVWFPLLFPLVSDAEVWGPFALIQDSSPSLLYVTTLTVYFTLPSSAQAFMTHCFITKASAAAVTQVDESGQQLTPFLSMKLIKGRRVSAFKTHKAWRVDPRALDSLTHSINDHLLGLGTGMQINKHVITNMIISTSSKKGWWKCFVRSQKVSLQSQDCQLGYKTSASIISPFPSFTELLSL